MRDLASLPKKGINDDDIPTEFVELVVLRDPYTPLRNPTLIYNTYFEPIQHVVYVPTSNIDSHPETWEDVGLSEFEVESRGIPFDDAAWEIFRSGGHVLWTWTPKDQQESKRPQHSPQMDRLIVGLAARMRLSEIILSTLRDNGRIAGQDVDHLQNKEAFKHEYRTQVMGLTQDSKGNYIDSKGNRFDENGKKVSIIKYYKERHGSFRKLYSTSSQSLKASLQCEIEEYDELYQSNRVLGPTALIHSEYSLLRTLMNGLKRAEAVQKSLRSTREHLHTKNERLVSERQVLSGKKDDYDLSLEEYFLIALHTGLNPHLLHQELIAYSDFLDVAVWLGQLGRTERLEFRPEVGKALIQALNVTPPRHLNRAACHVLFRNIIHYVTLFTDSSELFAAAEKAMNTGRTTIIERRRFGYIDGTQKAAGNHPDATRSMTVTSKRRKKKNRNPVFAFTHDIHEPWANGESIIAGPFIPLAWQ